MSITLFALSGAAIAVSSGVMAFVMFAVGRTRLHFLWGVFCISVFVWGLGGYFVGSTLDVTSAFWWWRFAHVGVAFIPVLFLHFVLVFLRRKRTVLLAALYVAAIAFSAFGLWSDLLIAHMQLVFGAFYYDSPPGLLYPLFTAYFFGLTILSHTLLYRAYHAKDVPEIDRTRIRYFFLGMLISFTGGSLCFLPVYGLDVYPVTNFAIIIYPIIIGYAILRHQLFDIRVATAQGLTFLLWMFVGLRLVFSATRGELLVNVALFLSVVILGIFLVRSIARELQARDRVERQERDLEAANHELAEANRRQESLIHFLSHEVKGYLAKSAAAFAAIAGGDYGPVSGELRHLTTAAFDDTRKGVDTVVEILSAGDFKSGTVSYTMAPFDLGVEIERIVGEYRRVAREKGLMLEVGPHTGGSWIVIGDRLQLGKHVFGNLIDNAIKYTPKGTIRVSLTRRGEKIVLEVRDSGVGITSEDQARLFREGGRGAHAVSVNPHSTGYGLFIAKSIVEAHGGRIWAESAGDGKGSAFFVALPAAKVGSAGDTPVGTMSAPTEAVQEHAGSQIAGVPGDMV